MGKPFETRRVEPFDDLGDVERDELHALDDEPLLGRHDFYDSHTGRTEIMTYKCKNGHRGRGKSSHAYFVVGDEESANDAEAVLRKNHQLNYPGCTAELEFSW